MQAAHQHDPCSSPRLAFRCKVLCLRPPGCTDLSTPCFDHTGTAAVAEALATLLEDWDGGDGGDGEPLTAEVLEHNPNPDRNAIPDLNPNLSPRPSPSPSPSPTPNPNPNPRCSSAGCALRGSPRSRTLARFAHASCWAAVPSTQTWWVRIRLRLRLRLRLRVRVRVRVRVGVRVRARLARQP